MKGRRLSQSRLVSGEIWFEARQENGMYHLRWTQAGEAFISEGGRILRFIEKPAAKPISIKILQRIVRAYAASLKGRDALHATTLEKDGGAIALIAPSGEGKSTLAAYLLRSDPAVRLLSDDLLYTRMTNRGAWAVPTKKGPFLKLSKETSRRFAFNAGRFDPHLEKEIIRPRSATGRPVPLTAIFQLYRGGRVFRLKQTRGAKASLILMSNMYNELLRPRRVLKNQFELCAALGRLVPVYRLTFPSGFKSLPAVASRLHRIWSG